MVLRSGILRIVVLLPAVLTECAFVLESYYGHSRANIAFALSRFIPSPGIEVDEVAVQLDAFARFKRTKAHFVDCLIAAIAVAEDLPAVSLDHDFRVSEKSCATVFIGRNSRFG